MLRRAGSLALTLALMAGVAIAGCAGERQPAPSPSAEGHAATDAPAAADEARAAGAAEEAAAAQPSTGAPSPVFAAEPASTPDGATFPPARDLPGLHNVIEVAPGVFSGSEPEGAMGFEALAKLGVKSILSVDGGRPDVEAAAAHGIGYAHVPVRYSEITLEQRLAITRAMRDLEGPLYIHCHHGRHRGPAAAATGLVALGALTPEEAVAFMKHAGTSSKYPGLYQCAAESKPLGAGAIELVAMPPAVAEVPGFVAAMADVGRSQENLLLIAESGWTAPPNHPDLAAASEAGQLADVLRVLTERHEPADQPEEFYEWMAANARLAQELEDAIVAGERPEALSARLKAVDASCAACHAVYRNE